MHEGKVLVARHQGVSVVKLQGDVRLTLCTTMDNYFNELFSHADFKGVLVDLSETECIDSTSLGLLAKLAVQSRRRLQLVPIIISPNPDITRLLDSMGFDKVFDICDSAQGPLGALGELPVVGADEERMRNKIIEAHRVLMEMNEKNRETFASLVTTLETGRQ